MTFRSPETNLNNIGNKLDLDRKFWCLNFTFGSDFGRSLEQMKSEGHSLIPCPKRSIKRGARHLYTIFSCCDLIWSVLCIHIFLLEPYAYRLLSSHFGKAWAFSCPFLWPRQSIRRKVTVRTFCLALNPTKTFLISFICMRNTR